MNWIPYLFLAVALSFLWIPPLRKVWLLPFLFSLASGLQTGALGALSLIPIGLLFLACYYSVHPKKILLPKLLCDLFVFLIGFLLIFHLLPGFKNAKAASGLLLAADSIPYTFYLNFDKGVLGFILLAIMISLCKKRSEWLLSFKAACYAMLMIIPTLYFFSWFLGYVRWDPKWPAITGSWVFANFFLVALSEEAFFRGFLLQRISEYCGRFKMGNLIALLISSLFFGLSHFSGGLSFVLLATVAGIFYGLAYIWSGRVEAAIFTHFSLNAVHFFLFSYPALS